MNTQGIGKTTLTYEVGCGIDVETVLAAQSKCFAYDVQPKGGSAQEQAVEWHGIAAHIMADMLLCLRRRFPDQEFSSVLMMQCMQHAVDIYVDTAENEKTGSDS